MRGGTTIVDGTCMMCVHRQTGIHGDREYMYSACNAAKDMSSRGDAST